LKSKEQEVKMPAYVVETNISTDEAIEAAVKSFGRGGLGLKLVDRDACCARFEGSGGRVFVKAATGEKTTVDLETHEWEYHVKRFIQRIA
jgi:hypothetical protein